MQENKTYPGGDQEKENVSNEGTAHKITQDDIDANPELEGQVDVGEEVTLGPEVEEEEAVAADQE